VEQSNLKPESSRRLIVFLCHSSGDKPAVRELYRKLRDDGFDPWFDEEDLLPGQDWREEIPNVIRACDVVLVCLSRASVTKEGYLQKEVKYALDVADEKPEGTIFIIPVNLEEDVIVPNRLKQWQWANLCRKDGYEKLVRALRLRATHIGILRPSAGEVKTLGANAAPTAGSVRVNPRDGQKYVWVPPGTFTMGCSPGDPECSDDEKPAHRVTISKGFWLGQTPVTVAAYERFASETSGEMPYLPAYSRNWDNKQMPIVNVRWEQAQAYCAWAGGRLPTEAEWEYAARAGSTEPRYGPLDEIAWYEGNSGQRTHEVGQKRPNRFGLYDMLGNVLEYVNDWYDEKYYQTSPGVDPSGPLDGEMHVLRGGAWGYNPAVTSYYPKSILRASARVRYVLWDDDVGFRCVLELNP
jgi:formylglycine-generating enzyme required for sulfatase activity